MDLDLHDILGDCSDESITESSEETEKSFGRVGKANVPSSLASSPAHAALGTDAADDPSAAAAPQTQPEPDVGQNCKDLIEVDSSTDRDAESEDVPEDHIACGGDSIASALQFEVESSDSDQTSDTESAAGPADRHPPCAIEIQPRSPGALSAHIDSHLDSSDSDSGGDVNVSALPTSPLSPTRLREARSLPEICSSTEMTTADAIRLVAEVLAEDADPALGASEDSAESPQMAATTPRDKPRATGDMMATLMSGDEAQPLGEEGLFELLDVDRDGVISREEFEQGLRAGIFQEDKSVTAKQLSSHDMAEDSQSSQKHGLQDNDKTLAELPSQRPGEERQQVDIGAMPESAEPKAEVQDMVTVASSPSPAGIVQPSATPTMPAAATQTTAEEPAPTSPHEPEAQLQGSLRRHNISPSSTIQDVPEIISTRHKDLQPADNSENESVDAVSVDFHFMTPDPSNASPADAAAFPSQCPSGLPQQARPPQGSHKRKYGVGATRQLIQELCRAAHRSQEEMQVGAGRGSQRRALAEAAAALRESSVRRLPPAPIPSISSAYEPLGEPEPTRVWHTPDAPGLWIRHDAPGSESPTVASDCARSLEAAHSSSSGVEASRPGGNGVEMKKAEEFSKSSQGHEAFRGMVIKASWLEESPLLGPVERAMQSLLLDKTGELSGQRKAPRTEQLQELKTEPLGDKHNAAGHDYPQAPKTRSGATGHDAGGQDGAGHNHPRAPRIRSEPPGDEQDAAGHAQDEEPDPQLAPFAERRALFGKASKSKLSQGSPAQVQDFASLRHSARANLVGAVAPETAGHGHAFEVHSPALAYSRRPETQFAHCPSLPQVPQLRSAGPARQEGPTAGSAPAICSRILRHDTESVVRTGDILTCSGLPSLVSPRGAPLPPRTGAQAGVTAEICEDLASAPRQPQISPESPSPVRLRPLPPMMTPEPRRQISRVVDGDGTAASWKHSPGVESSTVGNIAQLFDTPAEYSDIGSFHAPEVYAAAGGDAVAANCNSCIARAHQQVEQMRKQLLELAASCDTVECMAARLRTPLQPSAVQQDHHKHVAWAVSDLNVQSSMQIYQVPAAASREITDQSCFEELSSAHEAAMRSAAMQLTALKQPYFEDTKSGPVEGASLKRLQDWVSDMSIESRSRGPPCWAIAGMLEAAVEAIAQGANAPKVQFCSVVEAQLAIPHCRQEDLACQEGVVRANAHKLTTPFLCEVACGR